MGYKDDYQKQSRSDRQKRRPASDFWEMSKHGGAHQDKAGKHAKRAIKRQQFENDVDEAMRDFYDE